MNKELSAACIHSTSSIMRAGSSGSIDVLNTSLDLERQVTWGSVAGCNRPLLFNSQGATHQRYHGNMTRVSAENVVGENNVKANSIRCNRQSPLLYKPSDYLSLSEPRIEKF